MVQLRDMTQGEYDTFYAWMIDDYAREIARNYQLPFEAACARSVGQLEELLSAGLHSPGHLLFMIVTEGQGEAVGHLWCYSDSERQRAFIYDIDIFEAQQGKGYGKGALTALEEVLRPRGIARIGLHVFGDNTRAQALYAKMGYRVTGMDMQKDIAR